MEGFRILEDAGLTRTVFRVLLDPYIYKAWIFLTVLFGVVSIVASAAYPLYSSLAEGLAREFSGKMPFTGLNPLMLFLFIVVNNSIVIIVTLLLSFTIIVPILVIAVNGAVVGFISAYVADLGYRYSTVFAYIAPHGVIEVPAIALAASSFIVIFTRGLKRLPEDVVRIFMIAFIMILVAALVESTVTLALATALDVAFKVFG
ncbi:MAG: stage II sporulation protein M [Acidilobaceae archaeon]